MSLGRIPKRTDEPKLRAAFQVMQGRLRRNLSAPPGFRCHHVGFAPGDLDDMSSEERALLFSYCERFSCSWGADTAVRRGELRFLYHKIESAG